VNARPVIIDTDPGTDDALAIAIALGASEFDVLGLTSVAGNVTIADATRNALRLLEAFDRTDIGVWEGADGPVGGVPQYAYHFHGETGLTVDLGRPKSSPRDGEAAGFIVETARRHKGELEIIAIGPLTNVVAALEAEPELPGLLKRIWVMGGAFDCPGNVTPHAEFNFYSDPVAADRVLSSGAAVTVVGLDVCDRVQVGPGRRGFAAGDSPRAALSASLLDAWLASHAGERFSMCDPLAVAVALDPTLVTLRTGGVGVTTLGDQRGRSVFDDGRPGASVAMDVDVQRSLKAIERLAFGKG
jgi:inosine-uridine nucleoside N-ribohydrolase